MYRSSDPTMVAAAQQIIATAQAQTATQMGIPANSISITSAVPIRSYHHAAKYPRCSKWVRLANNWWSWLNQYVQDMPNGPEKETLLNFLAVVAKAFAQLQQITYMMEGGNVTQANSIAKAKIQNAQSTFTAQIATLQQEQAQAAKQAQMGLLMKILGPIVMLLGLVVAALTGGACAFLIALVVCAIMIADQETGFITTGFQALATAIENDPNIPQSEKAAITIVCKALIIALVVAASIATGNLGGIAAALTVGALAVSVLMESGIISDAVTAAGGSSQATMIASIIIGVVCSLVLMGAGLRAAMSAGDAVAEAAEEDSEIVAETTDSDVQTAGNDAEGVGGAATSAAARAPVDSATVVAEETVQTTAQTAAATAIQQLVKIIHKLQELLSKLVAMLAGGAQKVGDAASNAVAGAVKEPVVDSAGNTIQAGGVLSKSNLLLMAKVMDTVSDLASIADSGVQAGASFSKAKFDIIIGQLKSAVAFLEAGYKLDQAAIDSLLNELTGGTDNPSDSSGDQGISGRLDSISKQQSDLWAGALKALSG